MSVGGRPSDLVGSAGSDLLDRVGRLTLEQKVRLMTGADIWSLHAEPAIGLRRVVVSDGPAGVRGETWDERDPSANVPSPTALAATWDEGRVERLGRLLAGEARRKGVDVLLAPTVNLHRSPYGGRHFECFSEDPLLTARIGVAYVHGLQREGVGATVKHFVANDSETERFTVDARIDHRVLRELYLMPFEAIVREAGAWSVMAAYNRVNGVTMTENVLQRDVLKGEWAFDGVVMSDWFAGRSVAAAGEGLLDLAMPGPDGPWGDALVAAVRAGAVPESAVDDHVLRILRLAARVGALDGMAAAAPPARQWSEPEISAELRATAAAGFVLVRNEGTVLPLDPTALSTIAVLGPNAAAARTLGGGSATVFPPYVVSPLEGVRSRCRDSAAVVDATGGPATHRVPPAPAGWLDLPDGTGRGVEVTFHDSDDALLATERRTAASWMWWGPVNDLLNSADVASVRVRTTLRLPRPGRYAVGVSGVGGFTLSLDDEVRLHADLALPAGSDLVEGIMKPPQEHIELDHPGGAGVPVLVTYRPGRSAELGAADVSMLSLQLNCSPVVDAQEEFDRAVQLAAAADVAVVVVGTTEEVESEGFDRSDLGLPGRQDELVRAVAAANPRTVVVVNAGAPVLLPWADEVSAVLLTWFGGQEVGNALADVLFGDVEPGGRLPTSWPAVGERHPSVRPIDGVLEYREGLAVGYRRYAGDDRGPAYAFGHGLGYTQWAYEAVAAPSRVDAGQDVTVSVDVRNTGDRSGREVVQAYLSRPGSRVARPPRWLAGFATADAAPGRPVRVQLTIAARAFQHWDTVTGSWDTEPGAFRLRVGRSSADLRLDAELTVGPTGPS